jgi:hypothetical protein
MIMGYLHVYKIGLCASVSEKSIHNKGTIESGSPPICLPIYTSYRVIQVTGFKCGGMSVYAGFSHQATDGKGFFNFMSDWSEQATKGDLKVLPVHDRSITYSLGDFMGWLAETSPAPAPTSEPQQQATAVSTASTETNGKAANDTSHVANGANGAASKYPISAKETVKFALTLGSKQAALATVLCVIASLSLSHKHKR